MKIRNIPGDKGNMQREDSVNRLIHYLLSTSVFISASLLVVGLLIALIQGTPSPNAGSSLGEIVHQLLQGDGTAFLNLGLLVLMITPVIQVAMLIYGYARIARWRFVLISVLVLSLLGMGVFLGIKG